jgi:bifunctional enzyme CysN/CysC
MLHQDEELTDIESYLDQHNRKDMLRFLTCGSVDDGKSTLIGRLLADTKLVYEDQLEALQRDSDKVGNAGKGEIDYALLMDGLKSEREQGITIDVAYRYFSTSKRTFIIADTPGHEQYTRNMATGASNCNLAIILVDARHGVITQTKRHSFLVSLLGIKHVIVAVNKMDLVDYSEEAFNKIRSDYSNFVSKMDLRDIQFVPISALRGDNVVDRSENMPWYEGSPILSCLENVHIASDRNLIDFRFPVQCALRPNLDFRGFAGTVASGIVRAGDEVMVLPSGKRSTVKDIVTLDGNLKEAYAPMAVTLTLEDEIDISRGDVLVHPGNVPTVTSEFEAMLVWMHEDGLDTKRQYLIRTTAGYVPGMITDLRYRVDVNTLHRSDAETLELNEIGRVRVSCTRPMALDAYRNNAATGSFVVVDRLTNLTVAAGMVRTAKVAEEPAEAGTTAGASLITPAQRKALMGQDGAVVWLTGLPKAGKSPVAVALEKLLIENGHVAHVLDGSRLRKDLSTDLGFSADDRNEQTRRLAAVAAIGADAGLISIVASVSPFAAARANAKASIGEDRFLEVHCAAPQEWCEANDDEGIYAKARSGELSDVTGISAPYEAPDAADLVIDTSAVDPDAAAKEIFAKLGF